MSLDGHSNIRVFVRWADQTVFAGEEIRCQITFKNIARTPNSPVPTPNPSERPRHPAPLLGTPRKPNANNGLAPPVTSRGRGHRSTLSLNVPSNSRSKTATTSWIPPQQTQQQQVQTPPQSSPGGRPGQVHKRSLSIVSLGSASAAEEQQQQPQSNGTRTHASRASKSHGRSASLQISSRGGGLPNGPQSAALPSRPPFGGPQGSPIFNNSFPPSRHGLGRSGASTMPNTPHLGLQASRRGSAQMPDFKFPMASSPLSPGSRSPRPQEDELPTPILTEAGTVVPMRSRDASSGVPEHSAPVARILSSTSMGGGTPRSSGEFYSISNHSSETLASEYVTQPLRNGARPAHFRRSSGFVNTTRTNLPESLMMGYAQVQGSFTLDGSLINLGPFEQVKRKAVVGGQGGGVIGVETSKRDTGLLKGLGWGSWGNSIGELLGGGELSSIKDMRGVASSKSIPLLSTPQSILFVDLQLAPGETKAYDYTFKLPKGLPPSHRGRAMKISYTLVIGTQRPGGSKEQQIRSVEVPFRVLGSVNSFGEILGHDLMTPYVILRDQASVQALESGTTGVELQKKNKPVQRDSTMQDFLTYVDDLLDRPRNGTGLLSPTAQGPSSRRPSVYEEASTAKEAIDLAIIRSNMTSSETGQSNNRFEIARNGKRVGVIMLARPSYRLGEVVSMAIDFTGADIPCYAVHSALETSERIESTMALRSEASVHRVTRRVYGSSSEATMFARRVVFNPTIPISATPEFVTSGVNLEWKIRIEFVVPSSAYDDIDGEMDGGPPIPPNPLLEEIGRDDRGGLVLVAAEHLDCESFEVAVPLRVYGAVCNGLERLERDEAEEGLAV